MGNDKRWPNCSVVAKNVVAKTKPDTDRMYSVERIYVDNHSRLVRFLTTKLSSRNEAEDVAQEAFLRLLSSENTIEHISYPKTFLYRIAKNIIVDRFRKKTPKAFISLDDIAAEIPSDLPSPEMITAAQKKLFLIEKAVGELPPKCRKVFILHKFRHFSYAETAEIMGLTESMVRKYVARAILYCRQRLEVSE